MLLLWLWYCFFVIVVVDVDVYVVDFVVVVYVKSVCDQDAISPEAAVSIALIAFFLIKFVC